MLPCRAMLPSITAPAPAPSITIAGVWNCLAGGTDLALMCDMVLAADDAKIGFPATRANGTPPNHMWVYHVGPQWAKRLLMTGDALTGRDAARIGLVLDAVPTAELDAAVDELA